MTKKSRDSSRFKIIDFIQKHHVLTLATCAHNEPWCAHAFYVFDSQTECFYILSDDETKHIQDSVQNNKVAGAIVLESKIVGKLQGLQFQGTLETCTGDMLRRAQKKYIQKFPYAIIRKTSIWHIHIDYAKYTDNTLGFGTKLFWT
ncbi:MAG: pyridoxamine 5'-phosphate oxidase family protein [Bacteroidales bacterium]